jgi:diguanylate cyclase (GGDEF)-like protein
MKIMDIRKKVETIKNQINNRSYYSDKEYFELIDQLKIIADSYSDSIYCSKLKVFIRNKIAFHYLSKGDYIRVQEAIDLNLKYANEYEDKETLIFTYNLAALLNYNLSEYTGALNYFSLGLNVAREINDDYNISKILNNLGDLFYRFKEYQIANKYFLEASTYLKDKQENQKYISLIIINEFNISTTLLVLEKYDESLLHLNNIKNIANKNELQNFEILISSLSVAINLKITNNLYAVLDDYQIIINASQYLTNDTMNVFDGYCLAIEAFISTNHKEESFTLIKLLKVVVDMINTNKIYLVYYSLIIKYALKFEPDNTKLINTNYKLYFETATKNIDNRNESIADALNAELKLNETKLKHSEILKENSKLYRLSNTDNLTSLYNRLYFNHELNRIFSTDNLNVSLIIFDIDNLKEVNDNYGHLKGDKVLIEAARTLDFNKDENINVFRYGGDEFITIITNKPESFTIEYIKSIQNYLRNRKSTNINRYLSFSIGYTYTNSNNSNQIDIVKNADKALYQAKESGKDTYKKY